MVPLGQAMAWLAEHSKYTVDSAEVEEIIEGVLPE